MRASDADREGTAQVVQAAAADGRLTMAECEQRLQAVYRARTLAELAPLTQDLIRPAYSPPPRPAAPMAGPARQFGFTGASGGPAAWAVLSSTQRRGQWLVPQRFTANVLFGSIVLDLRQAQFSQPNLTIVANVLCGSVEIIVGDDVDTVTDGVALMGSFESRAAQETTSPRGSIRVIGAALMGSVLVRPASKKERRKLG